MQILSKDTRLTTNSEMKSILSGSNSYDTSETTKTMTFTIKKYVESSLDNVFEIEMKLKQMGLYPLEVAQIIDMKPKCLLDLQLAIEEMEERYDLETLNSILEMF